MAASAARFDFVKLDLADRSEMKGARERLSRHLMQLYIEGEKNQHRLTVHGLSYLQELDRKSDLRN